MNLRAKKSLGQNFLNSTKAIADMIAASKVTATDTVVEIGPGKGALTAALLETGARVYAYELDPRMIEHLSERFASYISEGNLTLIHQDILETELDAEHFLHGYKLIANIPYYITGAIIRTFLSAEHQPSLTCMLVQKEVAERMCRDPKESILSLSVKAYGIPRYVAKVSRRYFTPAPKVDSAIVLVSDISRNHFSSSTQEERYFRLVKQGFLHKRKHLVSNLADTDEQKEVWKERLLERGHKATVRAEELSFDDWLFLSSFDDLLVT